MKKLGKDIHINNPVYIIKNHISNFIDIRLLNERWFDEVCNEICVIIHREILDPFDLSIISQHRDLATQSKAWIKFKLELG